MLSCSQRVKLRWSRLFPSWLLQLLLYFLEKHASSRRHLSVYGGENQSYVLTSTRWGGGTFSPSDSHVLNDWHQQDATDPVIHAEGDCYLLKC